MGEEELPEVIDVFKAIAILGGIIFIVDCIGGLGECEVDALDMQEHGSSCL